MTPDKTSGDGANECHTPGPWWLCEADVCHSTYTAADHGADAAYRAAAIARTAHKGGLSA